MSRGVRYRVLRKIAHGGMAEIFLALQIGAEGFEKPVVLKRILPALGSDPAFVRMLVDEAHIVSTLNHTHLVQILDLGQVEDQFFLVLEFVDGFSLEQVRRRARKARLKLPLPLALYITSALCRGLDYVHRRQRNGAPLGIVHRDVTPQNVLLSREGDVKLADFGIAKAIGRREKSATGVIKGKFAYMSPEQTVGAELDARSDLFSVGTVLYLLTTGQKPFDAPTDLDVLMHVRKAKHEKPSTLVRDFNPDVERFIERALRADRSKRWQSAEQMADRLDAILLELGKPYGPAALKRWLETLSTRDNVAPPGDLLEMAPEPVTGTMQLVSGDLELQHVPLPKEGDDEDAMPGAWTAARAAALSKDGVKAAAVVAASAAGGAGAPSEASVAARLASDLAVTSPGETALVLPEELSELAEPRRSNADDPTVFRPAVHGRELDVAMRVPLRRATAGDTAQTPGDDDAAGPEAVAYEGSDREAADRDSVDAYEPETPDDALDDMADAEADEQAPVDEDAAYRPGSEEEGADEEGPDALDEEDSERSALDRADDAAAAAFAARSIDDEEEPDERSLEANSLIDSQERVLDEEATTSELLLGARANGANTASIRPGETVPALLLTPADAAARRTRKGATGRWLRRLAVAALLLPLLIGGGAYVARPYLPEGLMPPRLMEIVDGWLTHLPRSLNFFAGTAAPPAATAPEN